MSEPARKQAAKKLTQAGVPANAEAPGANHAVSARVFEEGGR